MITPCYIKHNEKKIKIKGGGGQEFLVSPIPQYFTQEIRYYV
jgi:hypothetical protein